MIHPGDRYCYGIVTEVARALRSGATDSPWGDLRVSSVLAVGESQSAFALMTYCNAVQPLKGVFDGFLIHSSGGAALSLGEPGRGIDLNVERAGSPTRIRTDLAVPVLVVQTETDVLSPRLGFLPARQPDTQLLRTWEVAGSAHADLWQIGEFEAFLGAPEPGNRGQQAYVLRSALRSLEDWVQTARQPPCASPLEVLDGADLRFAVDAVGSVLGGVRTPAVDVAVQVLSGLSRPDVPPIVKLFGRTIPIPADVLAHWYNSRDHYLATYAMATERAVAAGFVLAEDADEVLAEARANLIPA